MLSALAMNDLRNKATHGPRGEAGEADSAHHAGDERAAVEAPARAPERASSRIERIARRAYEIYRSRGGTNGRAVDDWLQAEREIDAE